MTFWPTFVEIHVWTTPRAAVTVATATMPVTSQTRRVTFWCGRASSMTARSRNGEAIATTDDRTMMAVTVAMDHRCGMNSRAIRRRDTSRACALSAAVTVCRPGRVSLSVEMSGPKFGTPSVEFAEVPST
jgi:hypothetical protein